MGLDPATLSPRMAKMVAEAESGKLSSKPVPAPAAVASTNLIHVATTEEQKLNKLERKWLQVLRLRYPEQNIGIQNITLKLADDTRYTPDFWTIDANGQLQFWETKGYMKDDARVKLFTAARQFRWARFILVEKIKGMFEETAISP